MRLSIAVICNYYFASKIFDKERIYWLDIVFKYSFLHKWDIFKLDVNRLRKMNKLWPPYDNIELTIIYTTTVYILLKYFLDPIHFWEALNRIGIFSRYSIYNNPSSYERNDMRESQSTTTTYGTFQNAYNVPFRSITASVAAGAIFTLLLPLQRLAEMHIVVIAMNYVHILITCQITSLIMFLGTNTGEIKIKAE
uniref:GPI mannosyltransferase I n=1 Tax=Heterorhabditis bacteriophora TaxID=37862 RepID=A0A1I7X648_HETBA